MKVTTNCIVKEVFVTKNLSWREIAVLDKGYEIQDGKLPEGKFAICYQVAVHTKEGIFELTDYSGYGLENLEDIIRGFLQETKIETYSPM